MYQINEYSRPLDYFSNHPKDLHSITQLEQEDCKLLYPNLQDSAGAFLFYSEAIKKSLLFHSKKIIVQETNEEFYTFEDVSIRYVALSFDGEFAFILTKKEDDYFAQIFYIKNKQSFDLFGFEYDNSDKYFKAEFSKDNTKIAISTRNYIQLIYVRHPEKQLFFEHQDLKPSNITWNNEGTLLAYSRDEQPSVYFLDEKSFIHPTSNSIKKCEIDSPLESLVWSYEYPNLLASLAKDGEISVLQYPSKPKETIKIIRMPNSRRKEEEEKKNTRKCIPHLFWSRLKNDPSFYLIDRQERLVHVFYITKQSSKPENNFDDVVTEKSNLSLPNLLGLLCLSFLILAILSKIISFQFIFPIIFILCLSIFIYFFSEKLSMPSGQLSMFLFWFKTVTIIYFVISFLIIWLRWDSIKNFIFNTDSYSPFESNIYVELLSQLFFIYLFVLFLLFIFWYFRPMNERNILNHFQFFKFSNNEKGITKTNSEATKSIQEADNLKSVEKKDLESFRSMVYLPPSVTPYGMRILNYYNDQLKSDISKSGANNKNMSQSTTSNKKDGQTTTSNKKDGQTTTSNKKDSQSKTNGVSNPSNQNNNDQKTDQKDEKNEPKQSEFIEAIQKNAKLLYDSMKQEKEKEEQEKIEANRQREKELKEKEEKEKKDREAEEKQQTTSKWPYTGQSSSTFPKYSFNTPAASKNTAAASKNTPATTNNTPAASNNTPATQEY